MFAEMQLQHFSSLQVAWMHACIHAVPAVLGKNRAKQLLFQQNRGEIYITGLSFRI